MTLIRLERRGKSSYCIAYRPNEKTAWEQLPYTYANRGIAQKDMASMCEASPGKVKVVLSSLVPLREEA